MLLGNAFYQRFPSQVCALVCIRSGPGMPRPPSRTHGLMRPAESGMPVRPGFPEACGTALAYQCRARPRKERNMRV